MKKTLLRSVYKALLVGCLITTYSCRRAMEELPKNQVDVKNNYQNIFDANAAVIGIYGKFLGLADRYIVLNELRADLMSPTANADKYLRQLNEHTETADNPWIDPKPWYNVILNINDAMAHFDTMFKEGKLTASEYQQRYSDLGALRCWLYLQLGTMYGDHVRYVTEPLTNLKDLNDTSKYPEITFDNLIKKLLDFMTAPERYMEVYATTNSTTGDNNSSLNTTVDSYNISMFFIQKYALLGDLYLWAGKYHEAAITYRYLADYGTRQNYTAADGHRYEEYRVCDDVLAVSYGSPNSNPDPNQVENPLNEDWRQIFADNTTTLSPASQSSLSYEVLWRIPFTPTFQPRNPFINLFSNEGGSYQLTASKSMINYWNAEVQNNGLHYDARSRMAVKTINNQPVIMKQLYYYINGSTLLPFNITQQPGYWLIYRTAALQQHFAEAACNDGQLKVAYALLNVGIKDVFSPTVKPADVTNTEQTFLPPPYDMDARSGGPQGYHNDWYRERGTRTRANLVPLDSALYVNNKQQELETAIINENALELGFEGYRWGDLLRIALRRNDPNFLAGKIRAKLEAENNPAAAAAYNKLMSPGGFYLPFKL